MRSKACRREDSGFRDENAVQAKMCAAKGGIEKLAIRTLEMGCEHAAQYSMDQGGDHSFIWFLSEEYGHKHTHLTVVDSHVGVLFHGKIHPSVSDELLLSPWPDMYMAISILLADHVHAGCGAVHKTAVLLAWSKLAQDTRKTALKSWTENSKALDRMDS
eukprot:1157816-Pelagomonas_calceolata.AAC.4